MTKTLKPFFSCLILICLAFLPAMASGKPTVRKNPRVVLETNRGKVTLELFADKAPKSTENMLAYVRAKHYDGLIFHRVIADFMIQGGGYDEKFTERNTRAPIKNEADNGLSNKRGTIAMARTGVVDSATSQFFINVKDNTQLDHSAQNFGYAVFGEVKDGMQVVDTIRHVSIKCPSYTGQPCHEELPLGMMDVPKETIKIIRARVVGG